MQLPTWRRVPIALKRMAPLLPVALSLLLGSVSVAAQGVAVERGDGETLVIRHPAFVLTVDPAAGGRAAFTKIATGDLVPAGTHGLELMRECFSEAAMEKPMDAHSIEAEIVTATAQKVVLLLTTTLSKETAGPDLAGVILRRTITVEAKRADVQVVLELENATDEARYGALGVRNCFWIDKAGKELTYLPTTRNVLDITKAGSVFGYYARASAWEYEPIAGWLGACDPVTKRGLAFTMDLAALESFYVGNNGDAGIRGWYYDLGELNPGAAIATRYTVVPFAGLPSLSHVSEDLLAATELSAQRDKIIVSRHLLPLVDSPTATLSGSVLGVRTNASRVLEKASFSDIKAGHVLTEQVALAGAMTEPLVVRSVWETGAKTTFERMVEGSFRTHPVPNLPLSVEYRRDMPERQPLPLLKEGQPPAPSKQAKRQRKALLFFGVYTQWYRLQEALQGWEVIISDARPQKASYLPAASEMGTYSLVIISNTSATSLPASVIRRIGKYVDRGGTLLVLGGPSAYGQGIYAEKGLEALLPIEGHPFDLIWHKEGVIARPIVEHPLLKDLDFSQQPRVYWHHQVKVKKHAQLLLVAGDYDPLLVTMPLGKGHVLCYLGTPMGMPQDGQLPVWEWDGWDALMSNIVSWAEPQKEVQ